jgi:hypothetical protein
MTIDAIDILNKQLSQLQINERDIHSHKNSSLVYNHHLHIVTRLKADKKYIQSII